MTNTIVNKLFNKTLLVAAVAIAASALPVLAAPPTYTPPNLYSTFSGYGNFQRM